MGQSNNKSHRRMLSLISNLSRAIRCCQQEGSFCENVTFTQFVILETVSKAGTLPLSDLHGILNVEKSTTTRLVGPLVNQGLIVREKSPQDSRAVTLKLTPEGSIVLKRVWDCFSRALNAIEEELPEQNRAEIYKAVRMFSRAVERACNEGVCHRR